MIDCKLGSRLLDLLADGKRHSLSALSKAQAVSELNTQQCLEALLLAGAALLKISAKDWQMRPDVDLLDKQAIEALLLPRKAKLMLTVVSCVDSTNDTVRHNPVPSRGEFQVVLAEMQTHGRGRQGRSWQAGFGKNIILSVRSVVHVSPRWLSRLPILSGVTMARRLRECGVEECGVKWPNDLVVFHAPTGIKKLAGILVESKPITNESYDVVIGVGLNIDTSAADIDQPRMDLKDTAIAEAFLQRSQLAAVCINALTEMLMNFDADNGDALLAQWPEYDVLKGLPITVKQMEHSGHNFDRAKAAGVGAAGELLVDTPDGRQALYAGDVSVRLR